MAHDAPEVEGVKKPLTQAAFLSKSKFKVFVPEEPPLRLSPTTFNDYIEKLIKDAKPEGKARQQSASTSTSDASSTLQAESRADENVPPKTSEEGSTKGPDHVSADKTGQPFVDALSTEKAGKRRLSQTELKDNEMLTENHDVAFKSSKNALVDLFYELEDVVSSARLTQLLENAWQIDPLATLKLIFNARSIHLGKSSRSTFYRCCGWLADNHPLTLLLNLRWITRPIISKKAPKDSKNDQGDEFEMVDVDDLSLEDDGSPTRFDIEQGVAHGYWKDLLNILALAANNALHVHGDPSSLINEQGQPRAKDRTWDHDRTRAARDGKKAARYENVQNGFKGDGQALYKALHLSVARLFGEQLQRDLSLLDAKKTRQLSPAAKWAPSQQGFHDRHTLIVTSIAEFMFPRREVLPENKDADRELYLKLAREAYRMKVVSPLRKALDIVEHYVTERKYSDIKYDRLPSLAMNKYSSLFLEKDMEHFEKYITAVTEGTSRISGATLLPSTLIAQCRNGLAHSRARASSLKEMKAAIKAELEGKLVDGQWKSLVQRIKDSGKIENSIAVCDVSGSMSGPRFKDGTAPIDSSVGLSLLLAEVTQPPFGGRFITFSNRPEIEVVGGPDDKRTLTEKLNHMENTDWNMSTNFVAVFEELILPMALENKIKQEDMVKQIFVFSDMQFDQCGGGRWGGSFERIKTKFADAGYEMPQLIFWNLAGGRAGYNYGGTVDDSDIAPKPTTAEESGVALVSGYSQGQLKMFLENGQFDDPEEEVKEKAGDDDDTMVLDKQKKKKMDPLQMVMKAISHRSYAMLKVVD